MEKLYTVSKNKTGNWTSKTPSNRSKRAWDCSICKFQLGPQLSVRREGAGWESHQTANIGHFFLNKSMTHGAMSRAQRMKIRTMNNSKLGSHSQGIEWGLSQGFLCSKERGTWQHISRWFYGCYGSMTPLYLSFQVGVFTVVILSPYHHCGWRAVLDNLCGRLHFSKYGHINI